MNVAVLPVVYGSTTQTLIKWRQKKRKLYKNAASIIFDQILQHWNSVTKNIKAQSAGTVEYTDSISTEG